MSFGAPLFLYALAALPVLIALVGWALARRAASVRRIGDPALIERLSVGRESKDSHPSTRFVVAGSP